MTIATLTDVLETAVRDNYAVAGLVCLGWEDSRAYVHAAEAEQRPVVLQAGPGCRAHTPIPVIGRMLRYLADEAGVPVVVHLDHGDNIEDCRAAIDAGFTSLMFDGSRLPLAQNIEQTAAVAELAHRHGCSCEGEIGFVGYDQGAPSAGTDPAEAAEFARQSGVDAMAVSVGNVHLQQHHQGNLDLQRIRAIEALTDTPLVIHGGSGLPPEQRRRFATDTNICKFNIGTELRQVFGRALRQTLADNPTTFDRIALLKPVHDPLVDAARVAIRSLVASEQTLAGELTADP